MIARDEGLAEESGDEMTDVEREDIVECDWCGSADHASDDCPDRDDFGVELWNEIWS